MLKRTRSNITLKDVAQLAGVHISTVSRVLNPSKKQLIGQDVKTAVESAAKKLGYQTNRAASALRTGRTHTIGVLLPDISNAVFSPILEGIEAAAANKDYFVVVSHAPSEKVAIELTKRLKAHQIDGLIVACATRDEQLVDLILQLQIPAVLVNRADETGRLASVISDDRLAMKLAVKHLIDQGHKKIAHIAGPSDLPTGIGRKMGFEMAMQDYKLKPAGIWTCNAFTRDAGREAMHAVLRSKKSFDALVCGNDLIALGVYDAAKEAQLNIAKDFSVTGHNDMPLIDLVTPALTTIHLPHKEMGIRACELLIEQLEGKNLPPSTLILRPSLVVRESSMQMGLSLKPLPKR
jgi:LacI family transcriptional regulator